MSDGVKGPNGPVYSPNNPPPVGDEPLSPAVDPTPQIPRTPNKAPKSILKNRRVQHSQNAIPQVNKKAREKMELLNKSRKLVGQLQQLLSQQQFMAHREALLEAIANPEALPEDFTVVYIDPQGSEVTVIPPDPQLQNNHEQEIQLRNELKSQVSKIDEHFSDDDIEDIEEAILTATAKLEKYGDLLVARAVQSLPIPETPQRFCLDANVLTAPPELIQLPEEEVFVLDEQSVDETPKELRFDEIAFSKQWTDFYLFPDKRILSQHYTLEEIRDFTDQELERRHDYIQLLFPNPHISENNPGAPLLTPELAKKIRTTPKLLDEALESVDQMLDFWGLERSDDNVTVTPNESARHSKWDGQPDHNHLRITRMLNFLMGCGKFRLALNIEQAMQNQRFAKQMGENPHWAVAVGRNPGQPREPLSTPTPQPQPQPAPVKKVHSFKDYIEAYPYDESQDRDRLEFYRPNQPGFVFTNFYKPQKPIKIDGEFWPTTEHYYQACKFKKDSPEWKHIQTLPDPDAVYQFIYPNRPKDYTPRKLHVTAQEWWSKRNDVMMTALRAKADNVPEFRQALLDSGNKILFEVSPKDSYWGTAKDEDGETGLNVLGAMLMQVRDELRAKDQ